MSAVVCPKCGSGSIVSAFDDAPAGVTNWVKCLICAKRFDPTTVAKVVDDVATIKQAFDDWEAERAGDHDVEDSVEASMGDEELDVFDDRDDPDRQDSLSDLAMKDERVRRGGSKERTMSRGWTPERRAKFMATMQAKRGGRGRQKKAQAAVENVPAIIATKPARAVKLSKAPMVMNGHALTLSDHAIERVQHDLATLERAKEIVASYA